MESQIRDRFHLGMKRYGQGVKVNDGHDWYQEAKEELLDCCVYLAAASIQTDPDYKQGTSPEYDNEQILKKIKETPKTDTDEMLAQVVIITERLCSIKALPQN